MEITHFGLVKTKEQLYQLLNNFEYSSGSDGSIHGPMDSFIPEMFALCNTWIPLDDRSNMHTVYTAVISNLKQFYNIEPWMLQQIMTYKEAKTNYPELLI